MDTTKVLIVVLAAAVIVVALLWFRGRKAKAKLNVPGVVDASVEVENDPRPAIIPSGVKIGKADATDIIRAHSSSATGGVELGEAKAKSIEATHTPGQSPPK